MANRTIWKFSPVIGIVQMPEGSEIIHVGIPGNRLTIWATVDPDATIIERHFKMFGTGHPIPEGAKHIYSWFCTPFTWHLFEMEAEHVALTT